jgi:hypothetical protein
LPAVVRNIDEESVSLLRNQGFGFGQIAHMYMLLEASGITIDEISSHYTSDNKGFGEIAKELGLHPSEIKNKIAYKNLSTDKEETSSSVEEDGISVLIDTESNEAEVITTTLSAQPRASEKQVKTTNASAPDAEVAEESKKQVEQARLAAEQKKAEEAKVKEEQGKADTTKKNAEGKNQQSQKVNENKKD